jgi:hypothetical protein
MPAVPVCIKARLAIRYVVLEHPRQGLVIRPMEMHASIRQEPRSILHVMARELSTVRALNRYRITIVILL